MSIPMEQVLEQIRTERFAQDVKWGQQNHDDGTHHNDMNMRYADHCRELTQTAAREGRVTWAHILVEEVAEALAEEDWTALRAELLQVAAVAVAWIEAGDRREQR